MSKVQDRTDHLKDVAAERLVLSSLFKYGEKYYYEVDGFLKPRDFTSGINQILSMFLLNILEQTRLILVFRLFWLKLN
jgi:replicative DNA helicase